MLSVTHATVLMMLGCQVVFAIHTFRDVAPRLDDGLFASTDPH